MIGSIPLKICSQRFDLKIVIIIYRGFIKLGVLNNANISPQSHRHLKTEDRGLSTRFSIFQLGDTLHHASIIVQSDL